MPMVESAFNNRQINVPQRLPFILKQFCKAAIRTQPYDLLKWSSAYFRALAEGQEPPTKIRLEHPLPQTISGLTLGFLKVLLRQLGDYNKVLSIEAFLRRWDDLCLDRRDLNLIMIIGRFRRKCQVKKFLAIAVGLLGSSLFETMLMICELFTLEPDGGSAMIPVTLFMEIYGYLAGIRCDGGKRESFDHQEDPSEFLIFDKAAHGIAPIQQSSLASQDTDADVNIIDLESSSKDQQQQSDTNLYSDLCVADSPKVTSIQNDGSEYSEADNRPSSKSRSRKIPADEESTDASEPPPPEQQILLSSETSSKSEKVDSAKRETDNERSSSDITLTDNNGGGTADNKIDKRRNSDSARKKIEDKDQPPMMMMMSFYPNVPGIGPRLMPEQVAAVAIWMSECAKLQEGMVGPRNLRHLQCPPLDHEPDTSES